MSLKQCPECGKMISSDLKQCIHCGKKLYNVDKMIGSIIIILFLLFILVMVLITTGGSPKLPF